MGEQWILDLTHELQLPHTPPDQEPVYGKSIYRIPNILIHENRRRYEPLLASFGPYHHSRPHLSDMEKHKRGALTRYHRRIAKASKTPNDVVNAMKQVKLRLLTSYDGLDIDDSDCCELGHLCHQHHHFNWLKDEDKFLELMITDGCFVLEVMLAEKRSAVREPSEYGSNDPVFGTQRMKVFPYLARDMLLLENQLPFLVLTTLAAMEGSEVEDVSTLIKSFYNLSLASPVGETNVEVFHILDLIKQTLIAGANLRNEDHLTRELTNAGMSFCKNKPFRHVVLNGNVLSLPDLKIEEAIESMLLNLIAFEHLHATADDDEVTTAFHSDRTRRFQMREQWTFYLTKELQRIQASQKEYAKSIYRVPKIFTDINREAYQPMLASFGPYHHNTPHLRSMEKHKLYALNQYLCRIAKYSKTLQDVFIAMREVEAKLLASYDSLQDVFIASNDKDSYEGECIGGQDLLKKKDLFKEKDLLKEKDGFLNLMIVDGCFALEVMLTEKRSASQEENKVLIHHPVFGTKRKKYFASYLARDMLLLENQLPLLALTTLAAIEGSTIEDVYTLIKDFYKLTWASVDDKMTNEGLKAEQVCKPLWRKLRFPVAAAWLAAVNRQLKSYPSNCNDKGLKMQTHPSHILELYRETLTNKGNYLPSYEKVHSATELRNAGVYFCKSKSKSFRDISFNGGVLSLPALEIDDATESMLLNLIAFEQAHATIDNKVTAYVVFMDNLIDTADDVVLLRKKGIINGMVGSEENIAKIFNKITKGTTPMLFRDDKSFDNVNKELNEYCKKRIPRWRASFVERHLKNPWVLISLIGALILLALTVLQTAYTIKQYYHG